MRSGIWNRDLLCLDGMDTTADGKKDVKLIEFLIAKDFVRPSISMKIFKEIEKNF